MDRNKLADFITQHEGNTTNVYSDTSSEHHSTIGIGFNLDSEESRSEIQNLGLDYDKVLRGEQPLNTEQTNQLFQHHLDIAISDAQHFFANFDSLPEDKQHVLVDMSYNLGLNGLATFTELKKAVEDNDWGKAADEMINSDWYSQVKDRGIEDVNIMRNGYEEDSPLVHQLPDHSMINEDYPNLSNNIVSNKEFFLNVPSDQTFSFNDTTNEPLVQLPETSLNYDIAQHNINTGDNFSSDSSPMNQAGNNSMAFFDNDSSSTITFPGDMEPLHSNDGNLFNTYEERLPEPLVVAENKLEPHQYDEQNILNQRADEDTVNFKEPDSNTINQSNNYNPSDDLFTHAEKSNDANSSFWENSAQFASKEGNDIFNESESSNSTLTAPEQSISFWSNNIASERSTEHTWDTPNTLNQPTEDFHSTSHENSSNATNTDA